MRSEVITCDRCKKPAKESVSIRLVTGHEPCPSGNGYIDETRDIDYCFSCVRSIIQIAYDFPSGELQRKLNL